MLTEWLTFKESRLKNLFSYSDCENGELQIIEFFFLFLSPDGITYTLLWLNDLEYYLYAHRLKIIEANALLSINSFDL